jgi:hypothetical protein
MQPRPLTDIVGRLDRSGVVAAHIGDDVRLEEAPAGAPPDGSSRLGYGLSPALAGMTGGRR